MYILKRLIDINSYKRIYCIRCSLCIEKHYFVFYHSIDRFHNLNINEICRSGLYVWIRGYPHHTFNINIIKHDISLFNIPHMFQYEILSCGIAMSLRYRNCMIGVYVWLSHNPAITSNIRVLYPLFLHGKRLTHWCLITHTCVNDLSQHWFRWCPVTCFSHHFLKQCYFVLNSTINNLTHNGTVTPYGDRDLGQHWLR